MKRKLQTTDGTTLVELLCVTVVLVLLGLVLNTGLQMALKSYRDLTAEPEAQLLLSTAADALADDLRYARGIQTGADGTLDSYLSDSFPGRISLELSEGQILAGGKRLLPAGAYGNGRYQFTQLDIRVAGSCLTVRLRVEEAGGSISAQAEFSVRCLNRPAEPAEGGETVV